MSACVVTVVKASASTWGVQSRSVPLLPAPPRPPRHLPSLSLASALVGQERGGRGQRVRTEDSRRQDAQIVRERRRELKGSGDGQEREIVDKEDERKPQRRGEEEEEEAGKDGKQLRVIEPHPKIPEGLKSNIIRPPRTSTQIRNHHKGGRRGGGASKSGDELEDTSEQMSFLDVGLFLISPTTHSRTADWEDDL